MVDPTPLSRDLLASISKDQRWIKAMEQLFSLIPPDVSSLRELVNDVKFESGMAMARAQQAIDNLPLAVDGSFYSTIDQTGSAVDFPTAATFNTTQKSNGVSVSGSQITVAKSGLYKIEVRIQL